MDKPTCNLDLMFSYFNQDCRNRMNYYAAGSKYDDFATKFKKWHYYRRNAKIREPVIFGVAFCVSDQIYNPFSGELLEMTVETG